MPAERFFLDGPFDQTIALKDEELRHLKVMRVSVGDHIEIVNGRSELGYGTIETLDRNCALIRIARIEKAIPTRTKILAQALPKQNHLDFIIEKGTELGVTAFWLFPGDYSEKKGLSPTQSRRLRALSIAALKQCGRLDLPSIQILPPLADWPKPTIPAFFGDTRLSARPPHASELILPEVLCFIGPEKGFSQKEIDTMEKKLGAVGIKLHDHILRVETAALVAMTLI